MFCEGKGFSVHSLRSWRSRQLEAERRAAPGKAPIALARVQVASPHLPGAVGPIAAGISVEVGGLRVRVDPGFDRATLAAVLDVIAPTPASGAAR